jgi:biopolymer transport protein ExbB/TolQ
MSFFTNIADLLLTPVQLSIYVLFVLSLFEAGRMLVQWPLRFVGRNVARSSSANGANGGYPIIRLHAANPRLNLDDLDVAAMKRLEFIRVATRVTPMLGLMATLIPMGPALVALTRNDVAQMGDLLRSAFSSVVLALAAASVCFWIATVRRRWCAEELVAVRRMMGRAP